LALTQINNGQWVCQADVANEGEEVAEAVAEMAGNDTTMGEAGSSSGFSIFEQSVLDKLDHLTTEQRNNHEFYTTHFQHLDLQIEAMQDQLATMAA